jgi:hypothetical protein
VIVLTSHWATTDDIIADLIAGLLMLAFGVTVLLTWSFQRQLLPLVRRGNACFIVRDANGHALAYVYFEDTSAVRSTSRCSRLYCS